MSEMRVDAARIKQLLADNIERFCMEHLDAGKRVNATWCVGSARNEPGESFVVHLSGPRRGQFYENAPEDRDGNIRTLIDIWMARYGVDFREALKGCEEWLRGIGALHVGEMQRTRAAPPAPAPGAGPEVKQDDWRPIQEGSAAWKYLVDERQIDPDVLRRYRVGEGKFWFREFAKAVPGYCFPWYDAEGNLVSAKYFAVARHEGKKVSRVAKGTTANYYHLVGIHAVDPEEGYLVITEGEVDMLSWASAGYPAVSLPMGAKADREGAPNTGNMWIGNDWDWLQLWQSIYVAFDADEVGQAAVKSVVPRLGRERCLVVQYPAGVKDANEALQKEAAGELPHGSLTTAITQAEGWAPELFKRASDYRTDIYEEFFPVDGKEPGLAMPWAMPFRIRPGELTVWEGYSKHGKTICQTFTMVHLAHAGERICIASLEMPPRKTLKNAMRMAIGREKPVRSAIEDGKEVYVPDMELFDRALRWLDERFYVYGKTGKASVDDVLEVFRYAAKRYGVTQFVVDSLMMLEAKEDDLELIKHLMQVLHDFAVEFNAHVHLVAHAKKSDSVKRPEEKYPPRKHDIFGSVHISNIADNVLVVWRHKLKEQKLAKAVQEGRPEEELLEIDAQFDAQLIVEAQRHGDGQLPTKLLWFDMAASWQYFDRYSELTEEGPRVYV